MLPLIAYNLLQSIELLAASARALNEKALAGFTVNEAHIQAVLESNPVLVMALSNVLGYEKCAEIVKRACTEGRPDCQTGRVHRATGRGYRASRNGP